RESARKGAGAITNRAVSRSARRPGCRVCIQLTYSSILHQYRLDSRYNGFSGICPVWASIGDRNVGREINRQEYEEMSSQVQVRQHGKVTVLTEDEFWSEIRQFKVRQLMNWHEELRLRRWHTEGLYAATEEYEDQLAQ